LRGQAGERSDRIVAPDPPVKGPPGREDHRQSAKESTGSDALSGDATPAHQPALRCISAPSRHPERTRRAASVSAATVIRRTWTRPREYEARDAPNP
jgi:hypothetical protein